MTFIPIDQMMAMCMPCSHCDKPAKYVYLHGDATNKPKYCDDHVPWKEENCCNVCWNEKVSCTCMDEDA